MSKIGSWLKKEAIHILPAFIFFLIMFHILIVTRAMALRQYGIMPASSAFAVIGALIVAKVILIADRIPFLNLYPKKPLIWNVILKTVVFVSIALLFIILEEIVHGARKYGGLVNAKEAMANQIVWLAFWARGIWIAVLIFLYCAAVELSRVVGADKLKEIFFGNRKRP